MPHRRTPNPDSTPATARPGSSRNALADEETDDMPPATPRRKDARREDAPSKRTVDLPHDIKKMLGDVSFGTTGAELHQLRQILDAIDDNTREIAERGEEHLDTAVEKSLGAHGITQGMVRDMARELGETRAVAQILAVDVKGLREQLAARDEQIGRLLAEVAGAQKKYGAKDLGVSLSSMLGVGAVRLAEYLMTGK